MFLRLSVLIHLFWLLSGVAFAQPSEYKLTRQEYISRFKDDAVKEMLMNGVPASITLAQAMLESGDGNSALAVYANNHFGIKCHVGWTGMTYIQDDDEKDECFRKYSSVLESYSDHSMFLKTRPRYAFLFDLKMTDYKGWAFGLKQAGYATDPNYAYKLIEIIEKYKLYELDKLYTGLIVKQDETTVYPSINQPKTYKVLLNNDVKYVVAKKGDSIESLANSMDMTIKQIIKYNEFDANKKLKEGEVVYLQPKRRRSRNVLYHEIKQGETIQDVSQQYAVKKSMLFKRNKLLNGNEPVVGQKIFLRSR